MKTALLLLLLFLCESSGFEDAQEEDTITSHQMDIK